MLAAHSAGRAGALADCAAAAPRAGAALLAAFRRALLAEGVRTLAAADLRSEVNNSLIIVKFFHKIQNFRQISDLFSQI